MSGLFSTRPDIFVAAIFLAIAIYVVCLLGRGLRAGALRFWVGEGAAPARAVSAQAEIANLVLLPALTAIAFVPALVILFEAAALEGFGPQLAQRMPAQGMTLLLAVLALFLLIQISYLMTLSSIGMRLRYCLFLTVLPLSAQLTALVVLGYMRVPPFAEAARLSHLFCLGILPFALPALHRRLIVPVVRAAQPQRRWRALAAALAMVALVLFSLGVLFGYGRLSQAFARSPGMAYHPAPEIAKGRLA